MNILFITGSINQGGAEFQILSLANLLQSRGYQVKVLALTDYDYYLPYINEKRLKYSYVPNNGLFLAKIIKAVRRIIKSNPDLVIYYTKKAGQVALAARIFSAFRFKLIISERTSEMQALYDFYYFSLAGFANRILVNNSVRFNYITRRFPHLKNKTIFVPNIIDINRFTALIRKFRESQVNLSYIGRISPEKNLLKLVEAVHLVKMQGWNISLELAGRAKSDGYLSEINKLISLLNLSDSVRCIGQVDDVINIYRKTDLLCLVSFFEGFSNVLSEGLSSGIPMIASNIEENRFLIEHGVNGFLVDPCNVQSIAGGIVRFLNLSEDEIKLMSENNRKKAIEIFDTSAILNQFVTVFDSLGFEHKV